VCSSKHTRIPSRGHSPPPPRTHAHRGKRTHTHRGKRTAFLFQGELQASFPRCLLWVMVLGRVCHSPSARYATAHLHIKPHRSRMVMDRTPLRIALLHVLPSVWINGGMLSNLLRAVVTPGGASSRSGPATRSRKDEEGHHCRQCNRCMILPLSFLCARSCAHTRFVWRCARQRCASATRARARATTRAH
jgi:hypothetical protein